MSKIVNHVRGKMDKPTNEGTQDQILRSDGHGGSVWGNAASQEEIGAAVDQWMDENIPAGQAVAIDKTLTVENAAAGAKAAGDMVMVSQNEPSAASNKLWIHDQAESEYTVPTIDDFNEFSDDMSELVEVSDDEPTSEFNKLWIDSDSGSEVTVPTIAEMNKVAGTVAPDYSELTFPVAAGTLCRHEYDLYEAKVDIPSVEAWTSGHWSIKTNIADKLDSLSSALSGLVYKKTITRNSVGRITEPFPLQAGQAIRVTNNTANALAMAFVNESDVRSSDYSVPASTTRDFVLDYNVVSIAPYYNATGSATFENLAKRVPVLEKRMDNVLINNEPVLASYTWAIGAFDATGHEASSTTRIRSDFIPVTEGTRIGVSGNILCLNGVYYDKNKAWVSNMTGWSSETIVPSGVSYFRFLVRKAQNNPTIVDEDISGLVARCSLVLSLPKSLYQYEDFKTDVADEFTEVHNEISELIYKKAITRSAVGRINEPFPLKIGDTIKVTNNTSRALAMAFVDTQEVRTSDYSVIANSTRYFVMGVDVPLDYNVIAIAPYYNASGTVIFENYSKRVPKLEMGFFTSSAYNDENINSKLADYAELFVNDSSEVDSFLFFTDPHIFQHIVDEDKMQLAVGTIEHTFNNSSANFVLDGGDWLQEDDTQAEACYKLARINGIMRHKFGENYYRMLGNHDMNEQGDNYLDQTAINALWFGKYGRAYYDFKTPHTRYYVFDSGSVMADSMTSYRWEQVDWFAEKLLENDDKHSVIALHIYEYGGEDNPTVHPFADNLTKIAQAYNARTTVTLNGETYNFSAMTGKVAFLIAGHTHYDKETTRNDIPVFITTRTTFAPTFDLCYVDYDNALLSTVRVGDGSNRTMTIIG